MVREEITVREGGRERGRERGRESLVYNSRKYQLSALEMDGYEFAAK